MITDLEIDYKQQKQQQQQQQEEEEEEKMDSHNRERSEAECVRDKFIQNGAFMARSLATV